MIPDCDAHILTLLDLFLSTDTTICSAATSFWLENLDHFITLCLIDFL